LKLFGEGGKDFDVSGDSVNVLLLLVKYFAEIELGVGSEVGSA